MPQNPNTNEIEALKKVCPLGTGELKSSYDMPEHSGSRGEVTAKKLPQRDSDGWEIELGVNWIANDTGAVWQQMDFRFRVPKHYSHISLLDFKISGSEGVEAQMKNPIKDRNEGIRYLRWALSTMARGLEEGRFR